MIVDSIDIAHPIYLYREKRRYMLVLSCASHESKHLFGCNKLLGTSISVRRCRGFDLFCPKAGILYTPSKSFELY